MIGKEYSQEIFNILLYRCVLDLQKFGKEKIEFRFGESPEDFIARLNEEIEYLKENEYMTGAIT